jgi:hypothetical protein
MGSLFEGSNGYFIELVAVFRDYSKEQPKLIKFLTSRHNF